ncbi:MAG: hypothetical protein ACP5N3_00415 [Candidatus Nanoarchaeia archaeon]
MKGQTQQVFIYIMVILVVGAVLLFGYRIIIKLIDKGCENDQVLFQNSLKQTLEKNTNYGDKSTEPINSVCGYDTICFVDSNSSEVNMSALNIMNSNIHQEIEAGTGNNVFLVNQDETKALYSLDYLVVPGSASDKGFLCIQSKGNKFYMTLEGTGKGKVSITG